MNIELKNGYVFPFDEDRKYVCYYGSNSVGKTVISNALDNYFSSQDKEVLHFSNDLLEEMIAVDDKTKNIQIFPKIIEIRKLEKAKQEFTSKYSFTKMMKEIGITTVTERNMFPKIKECAADDGIAVDNEESIYNKNELKDIFGIDKKKSKHSFYQLIANDELVKQLVKLDNIELVKNSVNLSVTNIRKKIVDDNLSECPVCLSPLDESMVEKIKTLIDSISLDDDIKDELLLSLEKDTNKRAIIDLLEHKESAYEWLENFKKNLDSSIIAYLYDEIDDIEAINNFRNVNNKLRQLKMELSKYEIPSSESEQNEYEKRIDSLLKEHKVFKRKDVSFKIKGGKLETKGLFYEDLSQSEKNFLKFLYFDILLMSRHNDNKQVELIIDDPFDSYDEATISNLLYIITNSFKEYSSSIDSTYVFSHSIRLFYLFKEVHDINESFELKWVEKNYNSKTLLVFNDDNFLCGIDYSPSDYWLAKYITQNATDAYSLIVASIILREFAYSHKDLCVSSSYEQENKAFYNKISNNVVHLRNNSYTVRDLLIDFKALYKFKGPISNEEEKIIDLINNVDENALTSISVASSSINTPCCSIYKLFIVKYLISLKTRQLIQQYLVSKHSDLVKNSIGDNIEIIKNENYEDLNDVILFFDKNKLLLNEFAHSFTKSFSPFFTYCYEDLVLLYLEAKKICQIRD